MRLPRFMTQAELDKRNADEWKIRKLELQIKRLQEDLVYQYEKMDSLNRTIRVFLYLKEKIRAGMTLEEVKVLDEQCTIAMKAILSETDLEEYEFWDKIYSLDNKSGSPQQVP